MQTKSEQVLDYIKEHSVEAVINDDESITMTIETYSNDESGENIKVVIPPSFDAARAVLVWQKLRG